MISQTDRSNIKKLKALRQHKMDKVIIDINRVKKTAHNLEKDKEKLEQELKNYQLKRTLKHDLLFKELQEKGTGTIEDFKKHQINNQQLVVDENEISQKVIQCEKQIVEKNNDIKEYELLFKTLNKKIESLKELESTYKTSTKA